MTLTKSSILFLEKCGLHGPRDFFLGGIARIISWISVGPPIDLFVFLGALELILPPLLWYWLRREIVRTEVKGADQFGSD